MSNDLRQTPTPATIQLIDLAKTFLSEARQLETNVLTFALKDGDRIIVNTQLNQVILEPYS